MGDLRLREAIRDWQAAPASRPHADAALSAHERAEIDPPWALLAASSAWAEVFGLVEAWYVDPLREEHGAPWEEIAAQEAALGLRLPERVRQWFALTGRRPGLSEGADEPVALADLEVIEGLLVLSHGHQGIGEWGVPLAEEGEPWIHFRLEELGRDSFLTRLEALDSFYPRLLQYQIASDYTPPRGLKATVQRWAHEQVSRIRPELQRRFERVGGPRMFADCWHLYRGPGILIMDHGEEEHPHGFATSGAAALATLRERLGDQGWLASRYSEREDHPGYGLDAELDWESAAEGVLGDFDAELEEEA